MDRLNFIYPSSFAFSIQAAQLQSPTTTISNPDSAMADANDQPAHPQLPPADDAVEVEDVPVVDPDNDDGYQADDEGDAGWPQDPFHDEDNLSLITMEGEEEEEEHAEPEQLQAKQPDNQN